MLLIAVVIVKEVVICRVESLVEDSSVGRLRGVEQKFFLFRLRWANLRGTLEFLRSIMYLKLLLLSVIYVNLI